MGKSSTNMAISTIQLLAFGARMKKMSVFKYLYQRLMAAWCLLKINHFIGTKNINVGDIHGISRTNLPNEYDIWMFNSEHVGDLPYQCMAIKSGKKIGKIMIRQ